MAEQKEKKTVTTPEGRLVNGNLFTKDKFNEEATASYKLEMAFNPDDMQEVYDALAAAADEKWGEGAGDDYFNSKIRDPILSGDKLKAKRDAKGKPGEAYAGKDVIRAHTIFNSYGDDGPGGIQVYDENVEKIDPARSHEVYNGCLGKAILTVGAYLDNEGNRALMFYLASFMKTGEGEKLVSAADYSTVFEPVARTEGEGTSRRRSRKG